MIMHNNIVIATMSLKTFTSPKGIMASSRQASKALFLLFMLYSNSVFISTAWAQGAISNGDSPTDSISPIGDIDTWTFNASSGDAIHVQVGVLTSTNLEPLIRLYDPNSVQVTSNLGGNSTDIFHQAQMDGTYTIEVLDFDATPNGTGTYKLYLAKIPGGFTIPAGDQGGPLSNGGVNSGTIDLADLDMWTFSANALDNYIISVQETVSSAFSPFMALYDPDGNLLQFSSTSTSASISGPAVVKGKYTVIVKDGNLDVNQSGNYDLSFTLNPNTTPVPTGPVLAALQNGGSVTGVLTAPDELHKFSLAINTGDNVHLKLGKLTSSNSFSPELQVFATDGSLISDSRTDVSFTALSSETLTVIVSTSSTSIGTFGYDLFTAITPGAFTVPSGDEGGTLINGDVVSGTLTLADIDMFNVSVNTGDNVHLRLGNIAADINAFIPELQVFTANGLLISSISDPTVADISFTATGTETLTVIVSNTTGNLPGNYAYNLFTAIAPGNFTVPSGDEGGVLTNGNIFDGIITVADMDLFQLPVGIGDNVSLVMDDLSGSPLFDPKLKVFASDGTLIISVIGGNQATANFTATNSETLTLIAP